MYGRIISLAREALIHSRGDNRGHEGMCCMRDLFPEDGEILSFG